jgi:mRNA interferase HigB
MFGLQSQATLNGVIRKISKASHPKVSILKGSRVVFKIKGNDYRLVATVQYQAGVLVIRFFGTHAEYDKIDAETV